MHVRFVGLMLFALSMSSAVGAQGAAAPMQLADRGPAFFTVAAPGEVRLDARSAAIFRRFLTLDLRDATVPDALRAIERAAAAHIVYPANLIPLDVRVTVRAEQLSLDAALTAVLHDVPADVQLGSDGTLLLVRHGGVVIVPVLRHQQATGTIEGRVTDSASRHGVQSATVTLEATNWRTSTDTSGEFALRGVRAGIYRVTGRLLGYRPVTRTVTVGADSIVHADLVLAKSASLLDQVVVTGTVIPTEVKALPMPISVISDSDIALQRPHTVQELFRQAVPTAVSWDSPAFPSQPMFSVRGASSLATGFTQMKVFVDGVEVADQQSAAIDPNSIARIEVIRGPQAAAIYGSDAIGGVMQIFTKQGDSGLTRPQIDMQTALGIIQTPYAGYRGVLRQTYTGSVRGGASNVSYNFGAGYSRTNAFAPDAEQSNPSVYGGIHFARDMIAVDANGRYNLMNLPQVLEPAVYQTGLTFLSKPLYQHAAYLFQGYGARIKIAPTPWWSNNVSIGVDGYSNNLAQTQPRLTTPSDTLLRVANWSHTRTSIGYNTSVQGTLGAGVLGVLTAGFDHYSLPFSFWGTSGAANTAGTINTDPAQPVSATHTNVNNTGYFAQGEVGFRNALFLTAGLRAEQNSGFGESLGTSVSPQMGISYVQPMPGVTLKLRGSWGRAIRPPDPVARFAAADVFSVQLANPRLGPERQRGWDGGVDAVFGGRGSLGVTYYDQTAEDLIQSVQLPSTTGLPTNQWQNVGRVKNTGVEVEGALYAGPFALKGQYGYTRARVEDVGPTYTGDLRVGDQTLATPKQTAGASLAAATHWATTVAAGITYVGSWNNYDYLRLYRCFGGTGPCQSIFRNYIAAYPGFVKVNATVSQRIMQFVSAVISVDNLTNNEDHEFSTANPVIGRITTFGLRFQH